MRTCEQGCNGCDDCTDRDEPAALADPTLKPDIAELTKRIAEDPGFAAQVTGWRDRPSTPVGWSDTDWLAHLERQREQCGPAYAKGPLPETGWD